MIFLHLTSYLEESQGSNENTAKMEAIKKKVQSMKVEKDNLCDRCDEVEQVGFDLYLVLSFHAASVL